MRYFFRSRVLSVELTRSFLRVFYWFMMWTILFRTRIREAQTMVEFGCCVLDVFLGRQTGLVRWTGRLYRLECETFSWPGGSE